MELEKIDWEDQLIADITEFRGDPLGFVLYAFDWGNNELKDFDGPEDWQVKVLGEIRDGLKNVNEVIQEAVASGHGVGKSCLVAWLILWALSTMEDTKVVVTANTENQLKTKTWPELAKWHRLFIASHWFKYEATSLHAIDKSHEKTWRADMIPWSEKNTEAFAGLHNKGKRILIIFDEASSIPDIIWEVTEGALTDKDTEIIWVAFGNPTRNTGRFADCFRKYRHRWNAHHVDSRTVRITNKDHIQKWIEDYGENSDFFKVRVRGEFPNQSDRQFISTDLIDAARGRHLRENEYNFAPVIIGVDPAWTGSDEFVIYLRQGLMSKMLGKYAKNDDDMEMAGYIAKFEDDYNADAVFIDMGYGTGIASAGNSMGRTWRLVSFADASADPGCLNKRMEIWNLGKQWLKNGGAIPDDPILCDQMASPEYTVRLDGKMVLESKDAMKKRHVESPNRPDALFLTFAYPVKKRERNILKNKLEFANHEYSPVI